MCRRSALRARAARALHRCPREAGKDRIAAYAVIGGVAGAGIAVGPILGGWLTTAWTWRVVLGIGMGLIVSQLGNVVLSSVRPEARSEAGGLQYTSQQFGSALGVALIGAIVISLPGGKFGERIASNETIEPQIQQEISVSLIGAVSFVTSADAAAAVEAAGLDEETSAAIIEDYEGAQLVSLKFGLLVVAGIVLISFFVSRGLPARRADELVAEPAGIDT